MSKVIDKIINEVNEIVDSFGYELIDIEYKKRYKDMELTMFIDKDGGITLDDCEKVHLAVSELLDKVDPTDGEPFIFNVSSPGLDRPYKSDKDFLRHIGQDVDISLYQSINGLKKFTANLISYDGSSIEVNYNNKIIKLNIKDIAVIHTAIKF